LLVETNIFFVSAKILAVDTLSTYYIEVPTHKLGVIKVTENTPTYK